ncbi:unnamed protein product, partial [Larinioides sclopetarius]
ISPGYNKRAPPGEPGTPANLFIDLSVLDIDRIDEARLEFSIHVYFRELWNDSRVNLSSFPSESSKGYTAIPDTLVDKLWMPDVIFENAKSGVIFSLSVPNTYISVLRSSTL